MAHDAHALAATATASADTEPFADSRRLTGPNPYFDDTGAVLETAVDAPVAAALLATWQANVERARVVLAWPAGPILHRRHARGATLAFAAPFDQLYAATEVNEWAWLEAMHARGLATGVGIGLAPGHARVGDVDGALRSLAALARDEARPDLVALAAAAREHALPCLVDNDAVSLGTGAGSRYWPLDALPAPSDVAWHELHAIPAALVTGSNGKTTTVRLLAAILRAHGLHTAHSCTDGLYLDGALLEGGDYSGPGGARVLLRNHKAEAAVLETARGGMLRHGLALSRADVAIVTNIQADHLGEYGIDTLDDLAHAKLTVARALDARGVLVLNADDARLSRLGGAIEVPHAWFAQDDAHPRLAAARSTGAATCAPVNGRLVLRHADHNHDLGALDAMPLTLSGAARYNVANLAAASLAAHALGVPAAIIASVLASFGSDHDDNPGRLQHWSLGGINVLVDFAHNPDGMAGLLAAANHVRGAGRLALTLGNAGDRSDDDLRALAASVAAAKPDRVLLKEVPKYLRGRSLGEVTRVLADELDRRRVPAANVILADGEVDAARSALSWAQPGDVLVLQALAGDARRAIAGLLNRMQASGWTPGQPLPATPGADTAQGMPA